MHALLAFAGSRGDAQPGILLAQELIRRGHRVTLAVSPNLVGLAEGHGIEAAPFGLDSAELLRAQRDDERFAARNPLHRLQAVLDLQRRGFAEAALDLLPIARTADIVVTGMACEEAAAEVARHRAIPLAALHFFPIRPTGAVPVLPTAWASRLPAAVNRLGWQLLTKARAAALAPEIAALRAALAPPRAGAERLEWTMPTPRAVWAGLRPGALFGAIPAVARNLTRVGEFDLTHRDDGPRDAATGAAPGSVTRHRGDRPDRTVLHAYDAELFPGLANELGEAFITGFPVVEADSGIAGDAALNQWLGAGSAPVYAGFGSMPVADPAATARMLREVCERRGMRLLLAGNMFRGGIEGDVAVVTQVDHQAVLPRCAVAVHHGGAGTTAAALRAGVPSVICSVQADQPYWGRQLEKLGLGVALPFARLTGERLERALRRATEPELVLRAAAYGMRFRDDGVARAAAVVESIAFTGDSPSKIGEIR
ncbi:glycosyltransferase [Nocardia yamanashiensis]|uniref:glycosyltransferase n=1 Tax=Nocardia yamanashiensis TaxID=209247 RepID=UPI001E5816AF|nr:glycosyltransferase [Nocardia yamanashiensis]UGT41398.1 glycosyltransferase [Nocardia yamanashiensis]